MDPAESSLLQMLEPNDGLRAAVTHGGGEVIQTVPFEAYLHSDPHALGFGYAQPVGPLPGDSEIAAGLRQLRSLFTRRGIPLSIEFNRPLFPDLPGLLESGGLVVAEREPLLVLDPTDFTPSYAMDVDVRFLHPSDPDELLSAYSRIFTEVLLERPFTETPSGVARLHSEVENADGKSHALALIEGRPVGTGFISTVEGVSEIARVATIPAARHRGVAATLTSSMLQCHFDAGANVSWLTASGLPAQRLYEKLGFRLVGERLYYTEP